MTSLLTYIAENLTSMVLSSVGLSVIWWFVLRRAAGLRFGKAVSALILGVGWCFRYCFVNLYVSTWLARFYSDQQWFQNIVSLLMIINVWLGIVMLGFVFRSNLLNLLFLEIIMEMIYGVLFDIGVIFISPGTNPSNLNFMYMPLSRGIILIIYTLIISFAVGKYGLILGKKIINWEPKYPVFILLFLVVLYSMGISNNISYAISRGNPGSLVHIFAVILVLSYLWVTFFHNEKMRAMAMNQELLRNEETIKSHYQQTLIQAIRVNRFNTEIRKAIDAIMERAGKNEGKALEAAEKGFVKGYLNKLEKEYEGLSVSRYSDDAEINNMLLSVRNEFNQKQIPIQLRFHDFHCPRRLSDSDMKRIFDVLCDEIISNYQDKEDYNTLEQSRPVIFQGGSIGQEIIISGEYPGRVPSGKGKRKLKSCCRMYKADISFQESDSTGKIIIGIQI